MNTTSKLTTLGLLATLAAGGLTPALADGYQDRSRTQTDKNNARNLALGAAAVAAYGLFSHNSAATLLGAAGAALAGSQYEKDRRQQSQDDGYYYRDGRNNGRYNGRDGDNPNQYGSGSRWNGNNSRYGGNGGQYNSDRHDGQYNDQYSRNNGWNGDNNRNNTDRDSDDQYGSSQYGDNGSSAWFHQKRQR